MNFALSVSLFSEVLARIVSENTLPQPALLSRLRPDEILTMHLDLKGTTQMTITVTTLTINQRNYLSELQTPQWTSALPALGTEGSVTYQVTQGGDPDGSARISAVFSANTAEVTQWVVTPTALGALEITSSVGNGQPPFLAALDAGGLQIGA